MLVYLKVYSAAVMLVTLMYDGLLQTDVGDACHLRVHIGPDNLVSFEAVGSPGQYLAISQTGTALDPRLVNPGYVDAKFRIRVCVSLCSVINCTYLQR